MLSKTNGKKQNRHMDEKILSLKISRSQKSRRGLMQWTKIRMLLGGLIAILEVRKQNSKGI